MVRAVIAWYQTMGCTWTHSSGAHRSRYHHMTCQVTKTHVDHVMMGTTNPEPRITSLSPPDCPTRSHKTVSCTRFIHNRSTKNSSSSTHNLTGTAGSPSGRRRNTGDISERANEHFSHAEKVVLQPRWHDHFLFHGHRIASLDAGHDLSKLLIVVHNLILEGLVLLVQGVLRA